MLKASASPAAEHNAKKRARARKPKPVEVAEQDVAKPSIRSVEDGGSPLQAVIRMVPEDDGIAGQVDDANDQAMEDVAYGNDMGLGQGFRECPTRSSLAYLRMMLLTMTCLLSPRIRLSSRESRICCPRLDFL